MDVFISHASDDKQVAELVVAALESRGIECWIAPRDVTPGGSYAESIVKAIRSCRVFVLIYSAQADTSKHVLREVERAVNAGAAIIPLRIEEVLPTESMEYFISSQHWLDAYEPPIEQHIGKLVEAVAAKLQKSQAEPTRSPAATVSSKTRSLIAKFAFGKLGCALTVTLLALFIAVIPASMFRGGKRAFDSVTSSLDGPPDSGPNPGTDNQPDPEMLESVRRQLREALADKSGTASSAVPDRTARSARWLFVFDTESPQTYLRQLSGLGTEVAFPASNDRWIYFSPASDLTWNAEVRDPANETRVYWIDVEAFEGVAQWLGVAKAPFMIVFLPPALEEKMVELEREFQGVEEVDILKTTFRVVERGGKLQLAVDDQRIR